MDSVDYPKLTSTTERDMDLLFLEEFECSDEFVKWFLQSISENISFPKNVEITNRKALHSITDDTGESDIVLDIKCNIDGYSKSVRLLIENKIDASFQEEQPERYQQRVQKELTKGIYDKCYCVLMAPNDYITSNIGSNIFDATISYETVIDHLKLRIKTVSKELGCRFQHKIELLEQSIYKYRRGYTFVVNIDVTNFWQAYYSLATQKYPILKMKKPGSKPSEGRWIHFTDALNPPPPLPRCVIKHKLYQGKVDLEFAGWEKYQKLIETRISALLMKNMRVIDAGKSMAISIPTPSIDVKSDFGKQREGIAIGLDAAYCLMNWFNHNIVTLQGIAEEFK